MERRVPATEARVHFGALMRRVVERGERILVERGGRPKVVILSYDDYQQLQASAQHQEWRSALQEILRLGQEVWTFGPERPLPAPEEVIRELREERLVQLTGLR